MPTYDALVTDCSNRGYADRVDYILLVGGSLGAIGMGLCWPAFTILFGDFMDTFGDPAGSKSKFRKDVNTLALYFLYIALAAGVLSYIESCFWMWAGNRQTNKIRQHYLKAVLRQDVTFFDVHATTGGLLTGLSEDSLVIQQAISEKVGAFIHHTTTFIAGFAIAFWKGWDMALVMVGCLPLMGMTGSILIKLTTHGTKKVQDAYGKANQVAQQSISQIRTVAANGREEETVQEFESTLETPYKVGIHLGLYNGVALGTLHFTVFSIYAAALFYGSYRVSHNVLGGYYSGGDVMTIVIASLIGGFAVGQGAPMLAHFSKGVTAAKRVFAVIDRKPAIDIEDEGLTLEKVEGTIELRNVSFSYPARPDVPIFRDFSLVVPGGQTVALVGSSGSGKSTVVQLIERFYDPLHGQVLLDGVDLRQLQLRWLRSQVGLVSQEPTLFATTILENIAMGRPGATPEEVQQAAVAANAHTFISNLPLKYETHVGERGLQLSGGQKQRIAIARAILKNPKVLLLDEATSALDTESERVVQEALDRMVVGRTTVVVAHRLSTVQGADCIAVVREGRLVEQGTHQQLLQDPTGVYTTLVQIQMQAARQEAEGASPAVTPTVTPKPSTKDLTVLDPPTATATAGVPAPTSTLGSSPAGKGEVAALEVVVVQPGKAAPGAAGVDAVPVDQKQKGKGTEDSSGAKKGVKGGEEELKEAAAKVPFSRLLAYNKPEWPYAVVGCIGSGMAGAVQPVFAFILVSVVVAFYGDKSEVMEEVSFYCWMFLVVAIGALVGTVLQQYCFGILAQHLMRRIRTMLLRNILFQEIAFFDQQSNSSAVLTKKLSEDTSYIRGAVGDSLGVISQNLLCLAIGYLIAFYYNWRMTLVVTGVLPLLVTAMIIYNNYVLGNQSDSDKLYNSANQTVTDAFTSIRVIQAYNLQEPICGLYRRLMAPADSQVQRNAQLTGLSMGYSQFMVFALYALVIWFAGLEISAGRSNMDHVLKAFVAILLAAMGIAQAQVGFPDLAKAQGSVQKVFPLLDRKSAIDASNEEGLVLSKLQGTIELRDVTFVYPTRAEVTVFKHFSLLIPGGQTVALVGESGSGKSTVISLIERFYDPLHGTVLLDGEDLRLYQLKWLRAQIALVSQEPLLFSRSILENIRYGCPEATLEEVQAAARTANAHDFISALPEGYDTQVGEQGVQLSGGQKQRVAIARAVIKNPRILLLDEATSALDASSEKVVQQALDGIMGGRTSVVVAHRLSTIRNADSIAFVHRGAILEQGTHGELMAKPDGGYAKLVAAQMGPRGGAGGAASTSASRVDLTAEGGGD